MVFHCHIITNTNTMITTYDINSNTNTNTSTKTHCSKMKLICIVCIVHFISIFIFILLFFCASQIRFLTSTYPVMFPTSVVVVFSFPIRSLFIHWFMPHLRRFDKVGEWASLYNFVMSKTSF